MPVQAKLDHKLRKFWFIHRYRMAPEMFDFMQYKLDEGRCRPIDQRVYTIRLEDDQQVQVRSSNEDTSLFDGVINCAGPQRFSN